VKPAVEKIHIIYKNLIRVGKELDFERFKTELVARGFVPESRVIPTPTGPLKEYLLREPKSLRDLIVVSSKGFVVDAWSYETGLDLISIAYEIYELILGDLIRHTLVDIIGDYQLIILINKRAEEILRKNFNNVTLEKLRGSLGRADLQPFSIGFTWGKPAPPHEWVVVSVAPAAPPGVLPSQERLQLRIQYRHVNPDTAVEFLQKLDEVIEKIVKSLL